MTANALPYAYSSYLPPGSGNRPDATSHSEKQRNPQPPRKPDWLLVIMGILFLITLLIAWLADIPGLLR